jgi:hypothetical protein
MPVLHDKHIYILSSKKQSIGQNKRAKRKETLRSVTRDQKFPIKEL